MVLLHSNQREMIVLHADKKSDEMQLILHTVIGIFAVSGHWEIVLSLVEGVGITYFTKV